MNENEYEGENEILVETRVSVFLLANKGIRTSYRV